MIYDRDTMIEQCAVIFHDMAYHAVMMYTATISYRVIHGSPRASEQATRHCHATWYDAVWHGAVRFGAVQCDVR